MTPCWRVGLERALLSAHNPLIDTNIQNLLTESATFADRATAEELAALSNRGAVYLLRDVEQRPVLLASAQQLRRVLTTRLSLPEDASAGPRADLGAISRSVRFCEVDSVFEADWLYYRCAKTLYPKDYLKRISFGPAWFLQLRADAAAPEIRVSNRVFRDDGVFLGPFPARTQTQHAMEALWDIFDLCRYPEQIRKSPHGQRCAYAEMGRCAAPCDGSQPMTEYAALHQEAWDAAARGFAPWLAGAEKKLAALSANLEFEKAGVLHGRITSAKEWEKRWQWQVSTHDRLRYAALIPTTGRKAWKLFLFDRGELAMSERMPERKLAELMPAALAGCQQTIAAAHSDPTTRMEQTWLFCRFLRHKQSEKAVIISLADEPTAADVVGRLGEILDGRKN